MKNVYRNSAPTANYWKDESEEMRVILTNLGLGLGLGLGLAKQ